MGIFQRIKSIFQPRQRATASAGREGSTKRNIFQRIFSRRKQTPAAPKKADDFIKQEMSDKELLNMRKYNTFTANNADSNLTYDEWDTMVTTLGTMGDTIEKFGYEAFKQMMQDLHDENLSLSKADMSYIINESMSIMRNSDKTYTQEDAIDLLRERIWLEYGNL